MPLVLLDPARHRRRIAPPQTLELTAEQAKSHQNPAGMARDPGKPKPDPAPNHRDPIEPALPHLRVGVGAPSLGARARAGPRGGEASEPARDPARACVRRPRRRRDDEVVAAASEKARLFCCCCVASLRVFNRVEGKKNSPRGVCCGEVTGRNPNLVAGQPLAGTGCSRSPGRRFPEGGVYGARVAETVWVRFGGFVVSWTWFVWAITGCFGFGQLAG